MPILNRDRLLLQRRRPVLGAPRLFGTGILDNLRAFGKIISPLFNILNRRGAKWVNELEHEVGYDLGKTAAKAASSLGLRSPGMSSDDIGRKVGETAAEFVNERRKGAALVPYGFGAARKKSDAASIDSQVQQLIRGTGLKLL